MNRNTPTTKVGYEVVVSESTEPWMQQDDHDMFRNLDDVLPLDNTVSVWLATTAATVACC